MDERNELSRVSQKYLTRYREITENMICKMNGADFTDSISQNFINQMIPHHEAAIEMSQNLLRYTTNLPLQNLADKIISGQSRDVEKMKSMLKKCSTIQKPEAGGFLLHSAKPLDNAKYVFVNEKCQKAELHKRKLYS